MYDAGVIAYSGGTVLFVMLSVLLSTAWAGRLQGALLLTASVVSALWCGVLAHHAATGVPAFPWPALVEVARDAGWFAFLLGLLGYVPGRRTPGVASVRFAGRLIIGLCSLTALLLLVHAYLPAAGAGPVNDVLLLSKVLLAVLGLALVEQLYRNTVPEGRWAIKFLCLGVGALFAYDLYLYSDALLFKHVRPELWSARGAVQAMVVPLIAISAARNPHWSVQVFVSRHVVINSLAVLASGLYLLLMAGAGYYMRLYGGTWGGVVQATFLFGAVLLLLVLLSSEQLRSRTRVFLSKHFFANKYDYRQEWLRFTYALSTSRQDRELQKNIVKAIAQIVESPGGVIWVRGDGERFHPAASWQAVVPEGAILSADAALARFLHERGWIISLDEHRASPERYAGLSFPDCFDALRDPWLVVPLLQHNELLGFVVLARSRTLRDLNWEDMDLLKTLGREAASYLAVLRLSQELGEARQVEAFNRLSAYVVHDLKNLVAQLSLVVSNAKKHRDNPDFMRDAIDTVDNATRKMNRLLEDLRKGRADGAGREHVELVSLLEEVRAAHGSRKPVPALDCTEEILGVCTDHDRLAAVLGHIVQNAQEATPPGGKVTISLRRDGTWALIEIQDTGKGMDAGFIAERLFRPFDTTKGNAGMGIGAYQSREFVRAEGGDIEVQSEPGKGTTFRLRLPVAVTREPSPARGSSMEAVD
ncbi:MAG: PEP-CTERM system histidine kinase PrsK [Gammaproteobacteria bacterium]|nr:PEP-CTERM system histidine kinase PrsK [Gammaproteobacteria bacterium]NIR84445.1 PEP-CTERM system histidine kinase PrsK [Gammaproteobacteria bacterium]NIR90926.1 PEP-CTERM system histidine kinase PrsK [Gammaproteobacteria bacterium]NIU07112.1 PEP-CTERM system histidine kinase PrsK [Gammaproteobacteria bacterium]NIV76241.1 PEP-CTERM system histidine kinase PrsK [Gammaproteobacteria bacterium]